MNTEQLANKIEGMLFYAAIQWCLGNLPGAYLDPMGDPRIVRIKTSRRDINAVMFFNHEGKAANFSYNSNNPKVSFVS